MLEKGEISQEFFDEINAKLLTNTTSQIGAFQCNKMDKFPL